MLSRCETKKIKKELQGYDEWERGGYFHSEAGCARIAILKCALINEITTEEAEGLMEMCGLRWIDFFYR